MVTMKEIHDFANELAKREPGTIGALFTDGTYTFGNNFAVKEVQFMIKRRYNDTTATIEKRINGLNF